LFKQRCEIEQQLESTRNFFVNTAGLRELLRDALGTAAGR
jgi:hypothetical protein